MKRYIHGKYLTNLEQEWERNMHYGRIVREESDKITFPAYSSPLMDSWRWSLLHSAAKEQLHGLGATSGRRGHCRKGCKQAETAYHVSSSCIIPAYTSRHDNVVYWTIRTLLNCFRAPKEVWEKLQTILPVFNVCRKVPKKF